MEVRLGQASEDGPREPPLETVDATIAHEMAHVVPALLEADPALVATPTSPATSVEALPAAYQELAGLVGGDAAPADGRHP
jgi:hypothetical protein